MSREKLETYMKLMQNPLVLKLNENNFYKFFQICRESGISTPRQISSITPNKSKGSVSVDFEDSEVVKVFTDDEVQNFVNGQLVLNETAIKERDFDNIENETESCSVISETDIWRTYMEPFKKQKERSAKYQRTLDQFSN